MELDTLESQAAALDNEIDQAEKPQTTAVTLAVNGGSVVELRKELADMIGTLVIAGSIVVPTMPQHFNEAANLKIADAVIALADRYGYNIRERLLGEDSQIILWVGLAFSLGVPSVGVYHDVKASRLARQAREVEVKDAVIVQPGEPQGHNAVVTGAD